MALRGLRDGCRARRNDQHALHGSAGAISKDGRRRSALDCGRHLGLASQRLLALADALQGVQVDEHVDQGILVDDGALAAQAGALDTGTALAVCAGASVPRSTAWLLVRSSAVRCL